jgi:hypothetical protein
MKKTVKIDEVITKINDMILHSPDDRAESRVALAVLAEGILMDADRYRGFCYLEEHHMQESENGRSVGVRRDVCEYKFEDTDATRVHYIL